MSEAKKIITYLEPAIPALSETFVYNEIFALRERGYTVHALSIHEPDHTSPKVKENMGFVHYLYREGLGCFLISFLLCLFSHPLRTLSGFGWLVSDFFYVGVTDFRSYKLIYQYLAGCRAARVCLKNGTEHIHVHFANVPCQVAMYASAISNIPFTVTSHANDIFEHGLVLTRKAERAKYFVTISDFNRKFLREIGMLDNQIRIVRCGVDLKFQGVAKKDSNSIRICSLGRLVVKKGMPTLIEAVAILKQRGVLVSLSIAGDGPELDNIIAKIHELDVEDCVELVGALDNAEVGPWMSKHDIFALACQKDSNGDMDGIPVVLMEAMMLGVSVITTRISGIPELVMDGKTGLLVEPEDPVALADAIEQRKLQSSLIENAADHVVAEFGRDVNINRLEHLFNE